MNSCFVAVDGVVAVLPLLSPSLPVLPRDESYAALINLDGDAQ